MRKKQLSCAVATALSLVCGTAASVENPNILPVFSEDGRVMTFTIPAFQTLTNLSSTLSLTRPPEKIVLDKTVGKHEDHAFSGFATSQIRNMDNVDLEIRMHALNPDVETNNSYGFASRNRHTESVIRNFSFYAFDTLSSAYKTNPDNLSAHRAVVYGDMYLELQGGNGVELANCGQYSINEFTVEGSTRIVMKDPHIANPRRKSYAIAAGSVRNRLGDGGSIFRLNGPVDVTMTANNYFRGNRAVAVFAGYSSSIYLSDLTVRAQGNPDMITALRADYITHISGGGFRSEGYNYGQSYLDNSQLGTHIILTGNNYSIHLPAGAIAFHAIGSVPKEGQKANIRAENDHPLHLDVEGNLVAEKGGQILLNAFENSTIRGDLKSYGSEITVNTDGRMTLTGDLFADLSGKTQFFAGDRTVLTGALSTLRRGTVSVALGEKASYTGSISNESGTVSLSTGNHAVLDVMNTTALYGGTTDIRAGAGSVMRGSLTASGATTRVALGTNSAFTGATQSENNALLTIDLKEGGLWHLTADSTLNTLSLPEGTLDLTEAGSGNASSLTVLDSFTGSGLLRIDVNGANRNNPAAGSGSDFLSVNGTSNGRFTVSLSEASDISTLAADDKLYFAHIADSKMQFRSDAVQALETPSLLNDYYYRVGSEADGSAQNWFITMLGRKPNDNVPVVKSTETAIYRFVTQLDWLNKRAGEMRYAAGGSGLWARAHYENTRYEENLRTNATMAEIGLDRRIELKNASWQLGAGYSYSEENLKLKNIAGSADYRRHTLSLYSTFNTPGGWYQDTVLRLGTVSGKWTFSRDIRADTERLYTGLSLEGGRRFELARGWFAEGQAQLQLTRLFTDSYATNHGVRVEQNVSNSIIARAGLRLGRDWRAAEAAPVSSVYLRADILHEYDGKLGTRIIGRDGSVLELENLQGSWYNVGAGMHLHLSERTALSADINRQFGPHIASSWEINAGLTWQF